MTLSIEIENGALSEVSVDRMKTFVLSLKPENFKSKAQSILTAEPEVSDEVLEELLLDEVDLWHSQVGTNTVLPLHEFLGVTREEYKELMISQDSKHFSGATGVRWLCNKKP